MAFEILETQTRENMPPTATLSYMRPKPRGKAAQGGAYDRTRVQPKLTVTLPTAICIAKSPRFQLMLGSGGDAGKLRIKGTKDVKHSIKPHEFKSRLMMRFGYVPKLGDEIFDGARCPVRRISDEEYEIDCPFLAATGN